MTKSQVGRRNSGTEKGRWFPGRLDLFNNEEGGKWRARPNTILIDSAQLESGEPLKPDFKRMVAPAIEEFKNEYRAGFPEETLNPSRIRTSYVR